MKNILFLVVKLSVLSSWCDTNAWIWRAQADSTYSVQYEVGAAPSSRTSSSKFGTAGAPDMESRPKYSIVFQNKDEKAMPGLVQTERLQRMSFANGTAYQCIFPEVGQQPDQSRMVQLKSRIGDAITPQEKDMLDNKLKGACAAKSGGWWVHFYCWDGNLRQYHPETKNQKTVATSENILGYSKMHGLKDGADGILKYSWSEVLGAHLSTTVYNGTVCDLSGQQRETMLQFFCDEQAHMEGTFRQELSFLDIAEPQTCRYVASFKHPVFCDIPLMKKEPQKLYNVVCYKEEEHSNSDSTAGQNKMQDRTADAFMQHECSATGSESSSCNNDVNTGR